MVQVSELTGSALDWAVAKCEGIDLTNGCYNRLLVDGRMSKGQAMLAPYQPSTDWAQGGPIIERERIQITPGYPHDEYKWVAIKYDHIFDKDRDAFQGGDTPLIAAMRCYVTSKGVPQVLPKSKV